jgi:hypothetical protein
VTRVARQKGELSAKDEDVYSQIEAVADRLPRLTEADLDRLGERGASYHANTTSVGIPS